MNTKMVWKVRKRALKIERHLSIWSTNNVPIGHSVRAPLEEWIKWRQDNFDRQIQIWRRHTEYWMDNYKGSNRLVVAYEQLCKDDIGAQVAVKVAEFLNRSDGVNSRPLEEIPCIWHTIVKYKDLKPIAGGNASPVADQESKRGGPKYVAPFSVEELKDTTNVLTTLLEKYRNDEPINSILVSYIDEVARRVEGPPEDENTIVK